MSPTNNTSAHDAVLISRIVDRAIILGHEHGVAVERVSALLDVATAHRICPLELGLLLSAGNGDFAHDVFGIFKHLDREAGILRDCFLPRTARVCHHDR